MADPSDHKVAGDDTAGADRIATSPLNESHAPREMRGPAVIAVFALGTGILVDRMTGWPWENWIMLATGVAIGLAVLFRVLTPRLFSIGTILLWACCGGLRHHEFWSVREPHDISTRATESPVPARITGRIVGPPTRLATTHDPMTPAWMQVDRTIGIIACESIGDGKTELPVSGRVRFDVTGHLVGVSVGDRVVLYGSLRRPSGPRNPQSLDYRNWLRSQQIDTLMTLDHPDHVTRLESSPSVWDRVMQLRVRLRDGAVKLLKEQMSAESFPVAVSLLLGDRAYLSEETRSRFIESGTMHLLAISGLHIGILAGLLHLICRLCNASLRGSALVMLLGIGGYTLFTDHRPPVLRAAVLATVLLLGGTVRRNASGYQLLAICAILLLLYSPADLFDIGAQLSFLAILAIIWSNRWLAARSLHTRSGPQPLVPQNLFRRALSAIGNFILSAYVMTAAIWLFTLPLTASQFQLVAPIGFFINALLIPFVAPLLAAGYLTLMSALFIPPLAGIVAPLFDWQLGWLLAVVEQSATIPGGHFRVQGPSVWWLAGYYPLLAIAIRLVPVPILPRNCWKLILVWGAVGMALPLFAPRSPEMRVQFLAVGHGGCIVLRSPSGNVLMYDCGAISGGDRVARIARGTLNELGVSRVDGLIISHADIDHFNGVTALNEVVPIHRVFFSQRYLDFEQETVRQMCDVLGRGGVPLSILQAGDRLTFDPDVEVEVLHPAASFTDSHDNAHSVVLRVRYAGRTLLFTGDLEGAGLAPLLTSPECRADVMTAPHHGSLKASPRLLGNRVQPSYVIVSAGPETSLNELAEQYPPGCTILSTGEVGAVTVTISLTGDLKLTTFLPQKKTVGAAMAE